MISVVEFRNKTQVGNKVFAWARVKDLKVSPYNVRPEVTEEEREEIRSSLAKSIKELGLQQIPVCTSNGEVYIGGRRLIAHDELGEEWMLVEIRDATPFEQMIASYTENFHRKEPNYLDEGRLFLQMCELGGISKRKLAKKLGVSEGYVRDRIRIWERLNRHGVTTLTFEQARLLALDIIPDDKREILIQRLETGEIDFSKLQRIISKSKAALQLIEQAPTEEIQKQLKAEFEDVLWTEDLSFDYLEYRWEFLVNGKRKLKKVMLPADAFKDENEATEFAKKCYGRCIGKKTETYWVLEVDPFVYKELTGNAD